MFDGIAFSLFRKHSSLIVHGKEKGTYLATWDGELEKALNNFFVLGTSSVCCILLYVVEVSSRDLTIHLLL